ncbi:hypothetical protein RvY_16997 [Ramazzottius varieornatus]|uniref:Uncharacterized protein n=1 Tax=Ramazzottius varieornatus TaxID=947166 RepID=A0A1D1W0J3_RAMVA|nr:hypothetical protein RvY_16997 [Ramazzottius varieornatus]
MCELSTALSSENLNGMHQPIHKDERQYNHALRQGPLHHAHWRFHGVPGSSLEQTASQTVLPSCQHISSY